MRILTTILLFLSIVSSANAFLKQEKNKRPASALLGASMKIIEPSYLEVSEPLILNTGLDIDMYNQLSGFALMPINKPEITIRGRKGMNYEVQPGDGTTWDMSIAGGKDDRTMPSGGKDKFNIYCAAKTFGVDEDISKKLKELPRRNR